MQAEQPVIVDLGMSDTEYLAYLAQGKDPVKAQKDQLYQVALLNYGMPLEQAMAVAPLFEQPGCSISEKILMNQALDYIWQRLTGQLL